MTYKTERAWKKHNAQEIVNDFIYAEDISNLVLENYLASGKFSNFSEFFPILLEKLKSMHQ